MSKNTLAPGVRELLSLSREQISVPLGRKPNPTVVKELVKSVGRVGLINPLTVVNRPDGAYELVAGLNRLEACKELGISPWVVVLTAEEPRHEIEFEENLTRLHLTPEQLKEQRAWAKEELKRRVSAGESVRKAAKALGLPKSTADRTSAGAPIGAPALRSGKDGKAYPAAKPSRAERATRARKAKELKDAGKTLDEVATQLGVSRRTAASDLNTGPLSTDAAEPSEQTIEVTIASARELSRRARSEYGDGGAAISIDTFARLIGTTPEVVSAWETGEQEPSGPERTLLKILSEEGLRDGWILSLLSASLDLTEVAAKGNLAAEFRSRVEAVKRGEIQLVFTERKEGEP